MPASTLEQVSVVLNAFTSRFRDGMSRASNSLRATGKEMTGFSRTMALPMKDFRLLNENIGRVTNKGAKFGLGIRDLTHGMRGFRMEMLGVMFFGMMLQRTFMGFLQPAMDAYGVFELFGLMLLELFQPIMDLTFPILLWFMQQFMDLPESFKIVIGILALIGVAVGTFLFLLGTLSLGIGSVIQTLKDFKKIKDITVKFAKKGWEAIKSAFSTLKDWSGKVIESTKKFLIKGWDAIKNALSTLKDWSGKVIQSIWQAIRHPSWDNVTAAMNTLKAWSGKLIKATLLVTVALAIGYGVGMLLKNLLFEGKDYWQWVADEYAKSGVKSAAFVVGETIGMIKNTGEAQDFIWRSGQGVTSFSPDDNLLGFKGSLPLMGGGTTIQQENHFHGFTMDDLRRELDDRDRRMVDEVRRLVKS